MLDDIYGSECAGHPDVPGGPPGVPDHMAGRLDAVGVPVAAAAVASTAVPGHLDVVPAPGVPVVAADAVSAVSAAAAEVAVPPMETREALQQSLAELDSFMSILSGSRNEQVDDFDMDSASVAATLVASAVSGAAPCLPVQPGPACNQVAGVCLIVARWLPVLLLKTSRRWKSGSLCIQIWLLTKCTIGQTQTGRRSSHLRRQPPKRNLLHQSSVWCPARADRESVHALHQ